MSNDAPADSRPDALFESLADRPRRVAVAALAESPEEIDTLDDLVDRVQRRLPRTDEERLRAALHHTHLPKLDDADVVDYDPERCAVEYVGGDALERWLAEMEWEGPY